MDAPDVELEVAFSVNGPELHDDWCNVVLVVVGEKEKGTQLSSSVAKLRCRIICDHLVSRQ
jgi:hypothetical protein